MKASGGIFSLYSHSSKIIRRLLGKREREKGKFDIPRFSAYNRQEKIFFIKVENGPWYNRCSHNGDEGKDGGKLILPES